MFMKLNLTAAIAAFSIGTAAFAEVEPATLQFAHIYNTEDHWGQVAEAFKAEVESKSDGAITINISPSGTTGDWPQSIEGLRIGTNQIVLQSVGALDRYGTIAGIEAFPYLIRDVDHFNKVYFGPVGAELFGAIEEQSGFHLLGAAYRGARHLSASRPAETLEELAGLKLRVPPLKMYRETWENLGASPVPMGFAEVFTSLEKGLIDGQENPLEVIRNASLYEVQDYVMETSHVIGAMTLIFSADYFNGLPEETQAILTDAAEVVMQDASARMVDTEAELRADLESKGMTFVPVDIDAFRGALDGYAEREFPELQEWVAKVQAVN
jgi:tripartite ATP-independent transporter DctP family solute receptor